MRRFNREVSSTARLGLPGVPVLYDFGIDEGELFMATGRVGRMVVDLLVDAGVPVRVLTHRSEAASALPANVEVVTGDSPCPTRSTQGCVVPVPSSSSGPPRRRLLRPWSSVWHPMRGVSSFSHHRTRRRTLSSGNRIRWRCSTPILSGSSRPPGSSRRSSGRGCSRRTRCGRPRFAPAVSSGGLTALPRQHPSMTATWQPSRRGPCIRTDMPEATTSSGGLCGLIYAAARQTRIRVWAAMVAAVLVSRPQKV